MIDLSIFPQWEKRTRISVGPCPRRAAGKPFRRILALKVLDGAEHSLHATKGFRKRSAPSDGAAIAKLFLPPPPTAKPRYALTVSQEKYLRGGNK